MTKDTLFNYNDYRCFLSDYLKEQKRKKSTYSARYFSQISGFSSANYCSQTINGKRNITLKTLPKIIKALKLKNQYSDYFEALVHYAQTNTIEEKKSSIQR